MRKSRSLFVVILVSALVAGCGSHSSKLIGDWDTSAPELGAITVNYAADGGMTLTGDFTPAGKAAKLIITGTWKEDGDKVHMTYTDVKFTGLPPEIQSKQQTLVDGAKKGIGMGTDNIMVVKFNGDDAFSSTDNKGVVSQFKRKGKVSFKLPV